MKLRIAGKFALKNLSVNKTLLFPFIVASSIMLSIFHMMTSLMTNDYVMTRHTTLRDLMNFGSLIVAIFSFIFIIYAKRFLIKRRNKEFALYGILGLEKKHIRTVILFEEVISFSIIGVLSLFMGHILGKLSFLFVNKLMRELDATLMNYSFSFNASKYTILLCFFIFLLIYIISILNIQSASPIELMAKGKKAEQEPKSKIILAILGLVGMAYGYYLALTSFGTLNSIFVFFTAVIVVIASSYLLFIAFSINVLKLLKKNKNFFYRTKNFLGISGMIYRMKANGASLASIAVLSTGVIISVASTISIYQSIENVVTTSQYRDYEISFQTPVLIEEGKEGLEKSKAELLKLAQESLGEGEKAAKLFAVESLLVPGIIDGKNVKLTTRDSEGIPVYLIVESLDTYNKARDKDLDLKEGQLLVSSNKKELMEIDGLSFVDKNFDIIYEKNLVSSKFAIETFLVVVPGYKELVEFASYYKSMEIGGQNYIDNPIYVSAAWDMEKENEGYAERLAAFAQDRGLELSTKTEVREMAYELDGGFLFLGIVVGIIFLTATVLITYYKQVIEGYEDRANYQIMKKVGLEDDMIKKTAKTQIIWMIFIPLLVALCHSFVASKIVFQLLGLFGIWSYWAYAKNMLIVILVFAVFYLIVFKTTSRIYYKIVG